MIVLQHREGFGIRCLELALIIRTKASERTRWHHERRLMKCGVTITRTRRPRVSAAGAGSETHIHRGSPSINPGLKPCSKFGIEQEGGPDSVLFLDDFDDVSDLPTIVSALFTLYPLSNHLAEADLSYLVGGWVPELIDRLPPHIHRARYRLHLAMWT